MLFGPLVVELSEKKVEFSKKVEKSRKGRKTTYSFVPHEEIIARKYAPFIRYCSKRVDEHLEKMSKIGRAV